MKYLSILLIIFSITACNNDDDPETQNPDALPALDVVTVKNFMPLDLYENAINVIFKTFSPPQASLPPSQTCSILKEQDERVFLYG